MKKVLIACTMLTIVTCCSASAVETSPSSNDQQWGWKGCFGWDDWDSQHLRDKMLRDSHTKSTPGQRFTTVQVRLNKGKIDDPAIKDSSGDPQFDFDCLQAVLGQSCGSHTISGDLTETFSDGDLKKTTSTADTKLKTKPGTGKLFFYVIPLSLSKRFGVGRFFSEEQLLDSSNIATIPNSSKTKVSKKAIETIRKIYCETWTSVMVIGEQCRPTLEEISKTKQEIIASLAK
jgi:hypothetical protein